MNSFHDAGILNKDTQEIFKILGHECQTIEQANNFAQQHLLRSGERWDAQEETPVRIKCKEHEKALMSCLKSLGMVDALYPEKKDFKYALLMGALAPRVSQRLDCIADLQGRGYQCDTIVLLGSERPLQESEKIADRPDIKTEFQMMRHLYETHPRLKKSNVLFVDTPMIKKDDGSMVRPNTDDTLRLFAQLAQSDGDCLVISNNPYLVRQTKVAQRILDPKRFPIYGAGDALDEKIVNIFIAMDEFARAIYEESRAK